MPSKRTRHACDRCHSQKLRCPRQSDDDDSCSRCLRAGFECTYSAPLRTGRPPRRQKPGRQAAPDQIPAAAEPEPLHRPLAGTDTDDGSLWPAIEDPGIGFGWDLDLVDFDHNFDMHPIGSLGTEAAQPSVLAPNSEMPDASPEPVNGSPAQRPSLWPLKTDATGACIEKLSRLCVRLYPLYKSSQGFAAAQKEFPGVLLSASTFETISYFLHDQPRPGLEGGCRALNELFIISRSLLDAIHPLAPEGTSSDLDAPDGASDLPPVGGRTRSAGSSPFAPPRGSASGSDLSAVDTDGSDGMANQLILACYLRLLYVYHALIAALYMDAVQIKETGSGPAPSLPELRLVVFAQLLAHLLERLVTGVSTHFARQQHRPTADRMVSLEGRSEGPEVENFYLKKLPALEKSIKDRLEQLQKTFLK